MRNFLSVAGLIFILLGQPVWAEEDNPNLTGSWVLNGSLSTDLEAGMRQAMGQPEGRGGRRGGGGGMGRGGGRGGGGMGGGRGGGMAQNGSSPDGANEETQKRLEQIKLEHSSLEIFQDGHELNLTNGLDITQLLYTDGRLMKIWTQQGEATATARWTGSSLTVERQGSRDPEPQIRKFQLSDDGQTLTITETRNMRGHENSQTTTLVYNRQ